MTLGGADAKQLHPYLSCVHSFIELPLIYRLYLDRYRKELVNNVARYHVLNLRLLREKGLQPMKVFTLNDRLELIRCFKAYQHVYPHFLQAVGIDTIVSHLLPHYAISNTFQARQLMDEITNEATEITKHVKGSGYNYLHAMWYALDNVSRKKIPFASLTDTWIKLPIAVKVRIKSLYAHIMLLPPKTVYTSSTINVDDEVHSSDGGGRQFYGGNRIRSLFVHIIANIMAERDIFGLQLKGSVNQLVRIYAELSPTGNTSTSTLYDHVNGLSSLYETIPWLALTLIELLPKLMVLMLSSPPGVPICYLPKVRGFNWSASTLEDLQCTPLVLQMLGSPTRNDLKIINRLYPPSSETDEKHITCKAADLIRTALHLSRKKTVSGIKCFSTNKMKNLINQVLSVLACGSFTTTLSTLLLTNIGTEGCSDILKGLSKISLHWCSPYYQQKILKLQSTCMRRCNATLNNQYITDRAVAKFAYWDLSFGRSLNTSDWPKEISNRCSGVKHLSAQAFEFADLSQDWRNEDVAYTNTNNHDKFYDLLRAKVMAIMEVVVPKRPGQEAYSDFLLKRNAWLASGSSGGGKVSISDQHYTVKKRGWAEGVPKESIVQHLKLSTPQETAVASEKYENGKSRAIYGTDPYHYMHSCYATKGFEERLHYVDGLEKGAGGSIAQQYEEKRLKFAQDANYHMMMADFADFNIQHTPKAQAIIYDCAAQIGLRRGAHPDWILAHKWIAKAKFNVSATFPVNKKGLHETSQYKVQQGMFSGTRSTDLINTVLNHAYISVAEQFLLDNHALNAGSCYRVHQGDDVFIASNKTEWCAALYYTMNALGLVFQSTKQMFGSGRGEFLRVLYNQESATGYLGRAICNMLLKPIQNQQSYNVRENLNSIYTSIQTCSRRGLNAMAILILYEDLIPHWSKIKLFSSDANPISMPRAVWETGVTHNGFSIVLPNQVPRQGVNLPPIPDPPLAPTTKLKQAPTYMTDDHIQYLSSRMADDKRINTEDLRQLSIRNNYSDVLSLLVGGSQRRKYHKNVSEWKVKVRDVLKQESIKSQFEMQGEVPVRSIKMQPQVWLSLLQANMAGLERTAADRNPSQCGLFNHPQTYRGHPLTTANLPVTSITQRPVNNVTEDIQRVITSSLFQSIEKTQTALGVDKFDALQFIAGTMDRRTEKSEATSDIISRIAASRTDLPYLYAFGSTVSEYGLLAYATQPSRLQNALAYHRNENFSSIMRLPNSTAADCNYHLHKAPIRTITVAVQLEKLCDSIINY